jgi:hypothetical protein
MALGSTHPLTEYQISWKSIQWEPSSMRKDMTNSVVALRNFANEPKTTVSPVHAIDMSGQFHTPAALPPGRNTVKHCIGGWVGSRVGPNI